MKDRDRRQGEGSEEALVESCLFEGKVYIGHITWPNQGNSLASKKGAGSEAGNPRMHTNWGKQVIRHPRKKNKWSKQMDWVYEAKKV